MTDVHTHNKQMLTLMFSIYLLWVQDKFLIQITYTNTCKYINYCPVFHLLWRLYNSTSFVLYKNLSFEVYCNMYNCLIFYRPGMTLNLRRAHFCQGLHCGIFHIIFIVPKSICVGQILHNNKWYYISHLIHHEQCLHIFMV